MAGSIGRDRDRTDPLEHCQEVLDYRFRDPTFLREALTHASGADHRLVSNERLEFLGDAILGAIVCELLFLKFPEYLEGDLTRVKSVVVSRRTCAKISRKLGFDEFLVLGKGMGSQDETPSSVLADVFESLIGAIYLDGGMEAAKRFIVRHIEAEIDADGRWPWGSQLQEQPPAGGAAAVRRDSDVHAARREGPRPLEVLQDLGADRPAALRSRLGAEQEGRRAARGDERPEPARRRASRSSD